ncbi:IspD/TarI family cytidylyltransferase [Nocardioides yefusunii]|uniref:2-C-methyl-D-erythritol 4-phosphate cytidylyltransferase n=1 Tax=Nocardioides yefusunii TaxID=2500546 RepID=A0ABW1QWT0_9ACTN|nr:2-C-methyl-D-erythritol 4-phosphate cytidylyltransferase [Nocardioides yefusunii]
MTNPLDASPATDARPTPCAVVVLAAGAGSRVGATVAGLPVNKVLLPLAGRPVLVHSVRNALATPGLRHLVVVARPGEEGMVAGAITPYLDERTEVRLVTGGASRHASEAAGIEAVAAEITSGEVEVVAVHDGARPLASPRLYAAVVATAAEVGGAVPVVPARSLVTLSGGEGPQQLAGVQTPQAFRASALLDAYRAAAVDGFEGTDTASTLEKYAPEVLLAAVPSGTSNLKVTFPEDVALAEALLERLG